MADFVLTIEAQDDLIAIQDYIARDNPKVAARVMDECLESFVTLSEQPFIGHKRVDLTSREVRFWSIYSYLIIYDATTHPISIVRVLSGYRDITSLL